MAAKHTSDAAFSKTVLRLLSGLRRTPQGDAIYKHIATLLEDHESNRVDIEHAYAALLDMLLTAFVEKVPAGSPLQVQLKLLLLHLTPPLSVAELTTLRNCLRIYTDELSRSATPAEDHDLMESALTPLLEDFVSGKPARPAAAPEALAEPGFVERRRSPRAAVQAERRVDSAYRQHLQQKRESIHRIQATLAQHITDTIRQNEEFGVLLEVELDALRSAGSIQEIDILRKTLVNEVEKLQHSHQSLTSRLEKTHQVLKDVEAKGQELSDELTRVHLLSLTDELTELPNRRAFLRRLEDEVGRVQRYGNALSLVIIDVDGFKAINDQYGHAAGDEVLRAYAKSVLSIFRHHDMVARYGGEEFAVLLPNTDTDGAIAAIHKVQRSAGETTVEINGTAVPLPTFSAGVALYLPGETPTDIIERADSALYRAKNLGRNRIELASNESSDAVLR